MNHLLVRWTALLAMVCCLFTPAIAQTLQTVHQPVRAEVLSHRAALVGAMPSDQQLHVSLVLPLRNAAALDSLLARLADPTSPDYRHFLTTAQFTDQFGPTSADFQAVVAFAQAAGLSVGDLPANRMLVPVTGSAAQIDAAFNVQINLYQHPTEKRTFFSADRAPSLDLGVSIAYIAGLDDFSLPHPMVVKGPGSQQAFTVNGSGPGGSYLGSDMRAAYYGGTTLDGNGQVLGLLEFGGYNLSDVNLSFSNAGQTYKVPVNNVLLDGLTGGPDDDDSEEVLDIVQAIGMAPNLSQVRVYIGKLDADILNSMAAENLAKQISCSWSWRPADPATADVFFKEMAAQGQSFFTASGDDGAFDAAINPFFYPAEDQYVTAVGGTHLATNGPGGTWVSETVWNSQGAGSGGGISPDSISIPSWQVGVANSANGGSTTLRNVPDVAMEGDFDNYACDLGQCFSDYAGTSFAAPRWAGFMALVNQQAVEAGNAPTGGLGFLNPIIYPLAQAAASSADFHDITVGNNDTGNQPLYFTATPGYDLTTGFGSTNGQKLIDALAGPQVPGFFLSSSQSTVGVNPGSTGSATITISDAGTFSSSVTLAVTSTLPSGVTASFSPNPATGSSVLTLTATAAAPVGTQVISITGTSGTLTATTNITVSVHAPNFTLAATPSTVGINQGASGTSTIAVQPLYGFTGSVNLVVTGLPAGVTASFSPTSTTGTSTLTLTASSTAVPNATTLTVTGTSGTLTASTTVKLSIQGPSFQLSSGGTVSLGQGSSATSYVYVSDQYGFTGLVHLAISGLPAGVTASFSPNPTAANSTITFNATAAAVTGQSIITITGTSGALTSTTTFTLGVFTPTFALTSSGTLNIGQGTSGSTYVYVSPQYGFTGSVNLSIAGLPAGVTALLTPNPTTSNSTITLAATSAAKAGQYSLTVNGVSGSQTASTTLTLGVYTPTFTLSSYGINLGQGTSGSAYVYVTPQYGFTGSVNLAASGLPAGVTATFTPNPTTGTANLVLQASSTATLGQYNVTITGTSGTQTATTTLTVGVYVPTFTLSNYGGITVGQGASGTGYVYVNPQYGFTGSVTMAVSGLPAGAVATFNPNPTSGSSALTVTAGTATPTGQYTLVVTGTSGTQTATTTATLGVYKPTFTLSSYGSVTLGQGTISTAYVYVTPQYGFTGSVALSVAGLPAGVTAAFSPNPTTGTSLLTFTASSTATLGQYSLTITGVSGGITATSSLTLGVYVPSFSLYGGYSVTAGQGSAASTFVSVNSQYGFAGSVTLAASGLPSGVTASFSPNPTSYSSTLNLNIAATAAPGTSTVTITGVSGTQTQTTTFQLNVVSPSFTLSAASPSLSLNDSASTTDYLYLYGQNGFTGSVTLAASGLPAGVTASFAQNPITFSSQLTLTASSTATPGLATVTITGTSGTVTASTQIALTVNAPSFTINAAPAKIFLLPGTSEKTTLIAVDQYGFAGGVTYAVSGLPTGVTASITPNPSSTSSVLTFTASAAATPATTTLTITGTSGSLTASTTVPLTIRTTATASTATLSLTAAGVVVSKIALGTAVTATASVTSGSTAITAGQVNFCDASVATCDAVHLLGSAQLTSAGTASFQFIPGPGSHSYKAVYAGTYSNATSASAATSLAVTASQATTTTIAQSGAAGNYTLTANVTGQGALAPSGAVSFLDTSNGNFPAGTANLTAVTPALTMGSAQAPTVGSQPTSVVTSDFNGDGIPDLAVANAGSSTISILLGNGNGTFTAAASLPTGSTPSILAAGDFNRDGAVDLAVTLPNSNAVLIYLGDGKGSFTAAPATPSTGSRPAGIVAGDYNGDGLLDLAVTNSSSSTVTILLGNGDGTFTAANASPAVGNSPQAIVQGDLNGDGIADLAVANAYDSTISILLGNGDGSFTPANTIATASYSTSSLALADLNGDGKLDLLATNYYGSNVLVLLGKGDGTFAAAGTSPSIGYYPVAVAVADLNNDGKPDLIVANSYGNGISVLLGNGDGTFTANNTIANTNTIAALAVADWNGDGVKDVAFTTSAGSVIIATSTLTQKATATATGISPLGKGQHLVDASYAGDTVYAASLSGTTSLIASVGAPSVTLNLSSSAVTTAQSLTVIINISGGAANPAPTGSVQLTGGGYTSGKVTLGAGAATITLPAGSLAVGTDSLTAAYTPDAAGAATYSVASGTATVTVTKATPAVALTTSPSAITFAQALTVSVAVSGGQGAPVPTGLVTLASGAYTSTPIALTAGAATLTIPAATLPVGTNPLSVAFVPDTAGSAIYTASTGSGSVVVAKAVPTLNWPTPASIMYGTALGVTQLDATSSVTGTFVYSPAAGTVPAIGTQTLSVTFTPADPADYQTATATAPLVVNSGAAPVTWTTPASISYGTALSTSQLNASSTVPGAFTYTPAAGTVLAAGTQTLSTTFTPTDTTTYHATTSTVSLTVTKAPLLLTASAATRPFGTPNPAFTGTIAGAVNGDTFTESFTTVAALTSNAGAYPVVPSSAGANLASYTVAATNGTLTITPAAAATSLALSSSNLTFTATVASSTTGVPTGTVTFFADKTLLGTGPLSAGVASFTTASFPTGNPALSAQYSGDTNFTPGISVASPVLTVTPAASSLTVSTAGTASDVLTFTVAPGYAGALQMACSGLPQNASCSFAPASLTFTGGASSITSTLTVHTGNVATQLAPARPGRSSRTTIFAAAFGLPGLLALAFSRRRRLAATWQTLALLLLLLGAGTSLAGCGGSSSNSSTTPAPPVASTPSGTYTVQVVTTGASGLTQTTNISVAVQ